MTPLNRVNDARHAAQIAGRFHDLQGLRQAVAGVGLLLLFGLEMTFPLSSADIRTAGLAVELWELALLVAGIALTVGGFLWVTAWYRRHYGEVERTRNQKRLGKIVGFGGAVAFLVAFEIDSSAQNYGQTLHVNLMDFTLALWIVAYWSYLGRPHWHYLVIAAIGFTLGIASISGIPPATFAWHLREATLYIAVASIVGGAIDHMILARSLSPSESPVGLEP
ncbi:MAG TPA: hypothetical protein VNU19_18275 [Candidatus Acidoferrum sp.]|jgi:hypothetical protein|nr:hypothetical protein [Candidatus Acidoferrum sp.]